MEGWVKLYRVVQEKPVWTGGTDFQKVLLVVILLNVNHKARSGSGRVRGMRCSLARW